MGCIEFMGRGDDIIVVHTIHADVLVLVLDRRHQDTRHEPRSRQPPFSPITEAKPHSNSSTSI